MRVVEIEGAQPTLVEVMDMARGEVILLRDANGDVFALSQVDDFDLEVELLRRNQDFMAFLRELSEEPTAISLQELRRELELIE